MEGGLGICLNTNSIAIPSARKSNKQNASTGTRRGRNSMAQCVYVCVCVCVCMWQGLQEITDYKKKSSHVTDTDVMLPDKLNTFFARFEDNTLLTRTAPFSVADVSKKV